MCFRDLFEKSRNNRKILLENGPIKAVLNPKSCLLAEMKESGILLSDNIADFHTKTGEL